MNYTFRLEFHTIWPRALTETGEKPRVMILNNTYNERGNGATIPLERGAKSYGGLAELGLAG